MIRRFLCLIIAALLTLFSSAHAAAFPAPVQNGAAQSPQIFPAPDSVRALSPASVQNGAAQSSPMFPASELVRLHVIASDDTPEAQAFKLEIRDAVAEKSREILSDCPDAATAYARLTTHLPDLEAAARSRARELGKTDAIRAVTGVFAFPDREYFGVTVPAGDYRAVRVIIGEGAGHNWWCILFPSLCLPTDGHSALADWLRQTFSEANP